MFQGSKVLQFYINGICENFYIKYSHEKLKFLVGNMVL